MSGPQGTWLPPSRTLLPPSRRPEVVQLDLQALVLGPQGTRFPPLQGLQPLLPLTTLAQMRGAPQIRKWRKHLAIKRLPSIVHARRGATVMLTAPFPRAGIRVENP